MNRRPRPAARAASVLVSSLALVAPAWSAQQIVSGKSEIAFTSKQMGVPVEGRFDRFDGSVNVDAAKPEGGKVDFRVDLASASIGTPETVTELKKPEWFDTGKYPVATFRSTAIRSTGPGKVDVVGKLTIKGIAKEIHVPMTLTAQGDTLVAAGEFTIKRLDYKIGAGDWGDTSLVADEVLVRPKLTLSGTPTP